MRFKVLIIHEVDVIVEENYNTPTEDYGQVAIDVAKNWLNGEEIFFAKVVGHFENETVRQVREEA